MRRKITSFPVSRHAYIEVDVDSKHDELSELGFRIDCKKHYDSAMLSSAGREVAILRTDLSASGCLVNYLQAYCISTVPQWVLTITPAILCSIINAITVTRLR